MFRALGDKLHHGDLHAAATDYDNGFYTPRIDGCQYILQHDSTTDFRRARNEHDSSRDTNNRLHTSSSHDDRVFDPASVNSSQHGYLNSSSSNEHAGASILRIKSFKGLRFCEKDPVTLETFPEVSTSRIYIYQRDADGNLYRSLHPPYLLVPRHWFRPTPVQPWLLILACEMPLPLT